MAWVPKVSCKSIKCNCYGMGARLDPRITKLSLLLGALHKIFVYGCTHFKPLIIAQMKHLSTVLLAPVLKSVFLDLPKMHLPVLVSLLPGVGPHAVLVQPMKLSDVIVKIL